MSDTSKKKSCKDDKSCKRLSIFACGCAVFSLLVQAVNYVEVDLKTCVEDDTRNLVEKVLEEKLREKLDAHLSDVTGFTSHRMKREAMLVSFEYIISLIYNMSGLMGQSAIIQ